MKIAVGSKNPTKITAVKEAVEKYPELFPSPEVISVDIPLDLYGHPKSLEDTIQGAMERAKGAFGDCEFSFGIESGLIEAPYTKTGYLEVDICAIYDGHNYHIGTGPGFEWPKKVFDLITKKGMDGSSAVREAGLTDSEKLGAAGGIISLLTKNVITRKDQVRNAVLMALVHLLNPELF